MVVNKSMKEKTIKSYRELSRLNTFRERFNYLKMDGIIGEETFGIDRYLNQTLYTSADWKRVRNYVIARDMGLDLGVEGYEIYGRIYIHHMNPITVDDIINRMDIVLDPEFLISTAFRTHNAIHFSDDSILLIEPTVRTQNDTCPWRH